MNELEKCMAGEYYDCHDPIFLGFKGHARKLLKEYNALAYEQKEEKNDMITHSLHVCSFATMLAFRLGMDKNLAIDIAKGGLLHDIGLRYLTIPYENCDIDRLSIQEQTEYRKHTINGYVSLGQESWLTERAKKIVLLHHEYENGSGYPMNLTSERIPDAVKIISICDVFDEMISGIGFCHRKVQEAIEFLIEKGYDINFGARPLKRTIQAQIETMIAKEIVAQTITNGSVVQVVVDKQQDCLVVKK